MEDIAIVLCDSTDTEIQKLLLDSVKAASAGPAGSALPWLAGAKGESVDDLIDRAKGLNSERRSWWPPVDWTRRERTFPG